VEDTIIKMEIFRRMARERELDLKVGGRCCLPREIKKYTGSISRHQRNEGFLYVARIQYGDFFLSKSFNNEADADNYICEINERENLPIKNKFVVFNGWAEVELAGGVTFVCNVEDLDIVESHTWYCTSNCHVATHTDAHTQQFFHNMVMNHIPNEITVDHINRYGLDNHKFNLRLVSRRIQNINRTHLSNNKSGVTGVSYDKKSKLWVVSWQDVDGNHCSRSFSLKKWQDHSKNMAIAHCKRMIRELPHYVEVLRINVDQR